MRVGEYLAIIEDGGVKQFKCLKCDHVFGPASENIKKFAKMKAFPITKAGPAVNPYVKMADFELREFYCPECAVMFSVEINKKTEPFIWDTQIAM